MTELVPPTTGRVILLNGAPSAGKSTLARTLQELLKEPYFHRSLDDVRRGYPERFWLADDGTLFRQVLHGYLRALRALAEDGLNIIAEAVVTPERLDDYLRTFAEVPVPFVGVRCPLPELRRREWTRRDRVRGPMGLAASDVERVHAHGVYDIEVDTYPSTIPEAARQIAAVLADPSMPTAFERLRTEQRTKGTHGEGHNRRHGHRSDK